MHSDVFNAVATVTPAIAIPIMVAVPLLCRILLLREQSEIALLSCSHCTTSFHFIEQLAYCSIGFAKRLGDLLWFHWLAAGIEYIDDSPMCLRKKTWGCISYDFPASAVECECEVDVLRIRSAATRKSGILLTRRSFQAQYSINICGQVCHGMKPVKCVSDCCFPCVELYQDAYLVGVCKLFQPHERLVISGRSCSTVLALRSWFDFEPGINENQPLPLIAVPRAL